MPFVPERDLHDLTEKLKFKDDCLRSVNEKIEELKSHIELCHKIIRDLRAMLDGKEIQDIKCKDFVKKEGENYEH